MDQTTKHTKHTKKNSEPRMDTNGHEWIKPRKTRKTRKNSELRMDMKREQMVIEPRMGTNICGRGAITIARMWVVLNCGRDAMRHLLTVRPSAKWHVLVCRRNDMSNVGTPSAIMQQPCGRMPKFRFITGQNSCNDKKAPKAIQS